MAKPMFKLLDPHPDHEEFLRIMAAAEKKFWNVFAGKKFSKSEDDSMQLRRALSAGFTEVFRLYNELKIQQLKAYFASQRGQD
jgi:hypothetical protein